MKQPSRFDQVAKFSAALVFTFATGSLLAYHFTGDAKIQEMAPGQPIAIGPGEHVIAAHMNEAAAIGEAPVRPAVTDNGVPTARFTAGTGTIITGTLAPTSANLTLNHAILSGGEPPPEGAIYHQVVDRYFDRAGNPVEVKSKTHIVDPEWCHGGRRQQDLIAGIYDDGKGNVTFNQAPETGTVTVAAR